MAHWHTAGVKAGEIAFVVGTLEAPEFASVSFFDDRPHHLGHLAKMCDRLSVGDIVSVLVNGSDAGSQPQQHPAAADSIQIERAQSRFDRAASEGERDSRTDL